MSETDDTDVLLLIPPNFFLVPSSDSDTSVLESSRTVVHKPVSCTAQVLGKLVNQVHSLESRLESLELDSNNTLSSVTSRRKTWDSDSFENGSVDRKCFTFPRRRRRKILRKDRAKESSLTSLDTIDTCKKTIPSLKLDNFYRKSTKINDLQSMDGDISSIVSTPSKKNDKLLLHEIDEFLTKVECYESPETRANEDSISPENVIKATGDYMTNKYDVKSSADDVVLPSGRTVSSSVLDKYIYLVKNNPSSLQSLPRNYKIEQNSTTSAKNKQENQETRSPSVRKLNFSDSKDIQPTSTPKCAKSASTYSESFKPSSNKIYDRATKVLEHYKSQNYSKDYQNTVTEASARKEEFKMPQMRPFGYENRDAHKINIDSIDTDLLSLSELWGEKIERGERSDNIKLEEERLKREHCESMIQQLQRKILEQQEKLAVAVKVDKAKDAAISKLRDAWLRLTGSLDKAEERHRSALEKMTREVDNFKVVAEDAQKKTRHFESELYKALDLAHDYQEKCKQLTAEKKELQDNMEKVVASKDEVIRNKDKEVEVLKENYETVMRLNKQSTDCVRNLEEALDREKLDHEMTKGKVNELNQKLRSTEEASSLVLQEKDILKEKVNEERSRCTVLERQLCDTQNQLSEMLRRCDTLENETKNLRKHLELQKTELKSHYQQQLEEAVLGKLHEFQRQLDSAERDMEAAARSKENSIVDAYNKQIVRIEEQHRLEVNVLEEKQREEIKLCRLQLAQATEKIGLLESKLETYRRRRGEIASQLHAVMEAQWRQALGILTRSHRDAPAPAAVSTPHLEYSPPAAPAGPPTRPHVDLHFEDLSDSELQHYVKMLLTKPPSGEVRGRDTAERPTSDRDSHERRNKPGYTKQPPWKA
ncbi:MAR-binding filament-like protein 1 [Zerene cesonia]|uniref:MAR-binding filament-like protein 1 n=1 Tax=Zerene cesonia TaxID=33412 RepID=UPI0018E4F9D5|nr:MAR-binding filament-like protein 1 [Zerene cesonia]